MDHVQCQIRLLILWLIGCEGHKSDCRQNESPRGFQPPDPGMKNRGHFPPTETASKTNVDMALDVRMVP